MSKTLNGRRASRNLRRYVLRGVTQYGKEGRPKIARDGQTLAQVERVKAGKAWECARPECCVDIVKGTEYARVTTAYSVRRMGGRTFPEHKAFHFECLPPEARALRRFFVKGLVRIGRCSCGRSRPCPICPDCGGVTHCWCLTCHRCDNP